MGYYLGKRENPCPRCGGTVWTVFISVGAMSFDERCDGCGTESFTEDERRALGNNNSLHDAARKAEVPPISVDE